jgi:CheY-like chemotaxis protein
MLQQTVPVRISDGINSCSEAMETILVVEDEPLVRSLLICLLREHGFFILEAANGFDAIVLAEAFLYPIHLLIADLSMPKMSGFELADHMASLHPESYVLFLSGYIDGILPGHQAPKPNIAFLQKPFRPDALLQKVFEFHDKGSQEPLTQTYQPSRKQWTNKENSEEDRESTVTWKPPAKPSKERHRASSPAPPRLSK